MRGQAGSPRAGVTFAASRFGSDGIFALNNEYRNATVSARARFRPDDVTEASLSYRYGDKTYHFPTDGAGRPVDSNQLSSERGPVASLAVRRTVGELELHATATFREARLVYSDEPDSPGQFGFASRDLVRRASGGVQLDWRRGDGSVLSAGLEYEDARQRGRNTFESPAPVARWNRAAYAQALFGAERSLSANAGFRLEDNSQFGSHPTYRGGVAYRLSTDTRLRAMVGTGFKEPTFFENFASGFVTGNPALEPEQSTSWEVGVEQRFGSSALVVTYFDQRFRDLIEYSPTPVSPNFVNYFNVAGAVVRGVEAVLDGPLGGGGMSARIAYTFLHTRVAAGGPGADPDGAFLAGEALLRRPAHTLTAQLRIAFLERGTITLDGRWVGRRDDLDFSRPNDDQRVSLPPYARIDANAEFDVIRGPRVVSLSARLENVFDSRAEEIANFPSRGRGLFLGARMRIGL
jgi:vitamin B12 transporter